MLKRVKCTKKTHYRSKGMDFILPRLQVMREIRPKNIGNFSDWRVLSDPRQRHPAECVYNV